MSKTASGNLNLPRILIVEDDPSIAETLLTFLEHEGYDVDLASHGQSALELLNSRDPSELPNLILLDLMMPVMSGVEFLRKKAKIPSIARIPVITMSAAPLPSEIESMVSSWLSKPVTIETLIESIQKALNSSSSV